MIYTIVTLGSFVARKSWLLRTAFPWVVYKCGKIIFATRLRSTEIDINPEVKELEEENIEIRIGSQSNRVFLRKLKEELPPIDIFIDGGGHKMRHRIITSQELFNRIKPDGVYLCEDLLTSYQLLYGGTGDEGRSLILANNY
ncbi:hypothetical protein WSM22_29570 [Cytophagales bacterium WSM2-2]|nr:hypothetical protein WSM22_29570 [Cytophagales bacterium WSM2-2]